MEKTIFSLLIFCFCFISSLSADSPKIHPDLQNKMNATTDNSSIPIYILMNEHLNLSDFDDISYDTPKHERRRIVIERLKNSCK
ncbi:MAG: hypothetical protein IPL53_11155 [Ignavibacteria bacterium]|nr:hypothetical protein [Ignavibacteria bacterium]